MSYITLSEYLAEMSRKCPERKELCEAILAVSVGAKIVSAAVSRAEISSLTGKAGKTNVQAEDVQKLDVYSDEVYLRVLGASGLFVSLVSEEQENIVPLSKETGKFVIAIDPLDGSSNIDVNVAIGTIWGIYQSKESGTEKDYSQGGEAQKAAGYVMFGATTMFVFTCGSGVQIFALDTNIGEFLLTGENVRMPETSSSYSCNEANIFTWKPEVQGFISKLKNEGFNQKVASMRYVGSLVADFHRILLKGGIFFYPSDAKNKTGKLRLLYECAPMAFLAEQAGGSAVTENCRVLNVKAESVHQRVPLVVGSKGVVEAFCEVVGVGL